MESLLTKTLRAELKQLRRYARLKHPLTWDEETWEVKDRDGKIVAYAGKDFMEAAAKEFKCQN